MLMDLHKCMPGTCVLQSHICVGVTAAAAAASSGGTAMLIAVSMLDPQHNCTWSSQHAAT
jgi:hypothetical protein